MSGSRRHIAIDLGASSGRVVEVVVSNAAIETRVLHRFANAPVAAARAGNLKLCWPFERMFEEILEGLRRAAEGDFDAILLAASGLNRLGRSEAVRGFLSVDTFLPAPGQGALALQTREGDTDHAWVQAMNHGPTALAVAAERGAMVALEGSCRTAVGAHAHIDGDRLSLTTEMLAPDGTARWRRSGEITGLSAADAMDRARDLGLRLGHEVHAMAGDQQVAV